ncbi:MAG: hypothetical protein LBV05_12120, partial [Comamonas sp.]|nr:hypothetical protein [Comamonas sp.]
QARQQFFGYVVFLGAHCAYGQAGLRRRLIVRLHKILHTLDSSDLALRCLFPSDAGTQVDLSDDQELNATFEELLQVRIDLDAAQKHEARLRQLIQMYMGEASKALFASGGSVTWKRSKDGLTFNTSKFVQAHPTLAERFMTPKPGSRRFCVYEPEPEV